VSVSVEKVSHENLGDKVYRIIKDMILEREVEPGDRLNIAELALALDVSRSLVRNALTLLAKDGLVEFFRRGIFVRQITRKEMQDLYELRKLVECFALEKGLAAMELKEIKHIQGLYEEAVSQRERGNMQGCYRLDITLHQLLVNSCLNDQLIKMFSTCQALMRLVILSDFDRIQNVEQSLEEHRRIIEALAAHNLAGAVSALTRHLEQAEKRVMHIFPE
jgi:DNA-binding GntR family transcriptional regulator